MTRPSGPDEAGPALTPVSPAPLLLACSASGIALWGLHHLDAPIARFVRSLHNHWDVLDLPWLAFISQAGDRLGEGWHLVMFSVALAIVGWGLAHASVYKAGVQSLLAHGLAAILANGLKHLIGRARPKFMHWNNEHTAPFSGSGWDSFPSGHATASFAVAAVVARHAPRAAPVLYLTAGFIAASRVVRGAHFLSDVAAGIVLGFLCGALFAHPLKAWRGSLSRAVVAITPYFVAVFGVLWALTHPAFDALGRTLSWIGFLVLVFGILRREHRWLRGTRQHRYGGTAAGNACIALGLALITGSPIVASAAGLTAGSLWLYWRRIERPEQQGADKAIGFGGMVREGLVLLGLAAAVFILYGMQGAVPLS